MQLINTSGQTFEVAKKTKTHFTIKIGKEKREILREILQDANGRQYFESQETYNEFVEIERKKEVAYLAMLKESCLALKADGNVDGLVWKDCTRYSQSNLDKVPDSFSLDFKRFSIQICCKMQAESNVWFFTSKITNPNPDAYNWAMIGKVSAQEAAKKAVQIVREYLQNLL